MKSQAFHLTAFGYGRDLVRNWKIKNHDGWQIKLWAGPIDIHGVELMVIPTPCFYEWFMIGNADVDDIMLMAHGTQRRAINWLPRPFAFTRNYLDLHCRAVGFASVFLNFYYEERA